MIAQGFVLMVVGMATVFSFLVLLVFLMSALSAVVVRFFPEKPEEVVETSGSRDAEVAAVVAAVKAFIS